MNPGPRHRTAGQWRRQYEDALRKLAEPKDRGVHFVGIGGVGMAGLADLMHGAGYRVGGCDMIDGPTTRWLRSAGIPIQIGHEADHLEGGEGWVVRSPAVPMNHPELAEAERRNLPVIDRGALLPAWMTRYARSVAVGGTHGKTTTACMLLHILEQAEPGVAYAIGGTPAGHEGVAGGAGLDLFVAEADESDGSLILYEPTVGVVTHAELDHVDYYATEVDVQDVYRQFVASVRVAAVVPHEAKDLLVREGVDARTFGTETGADYRAETVEFPDGRGLRFMLRRPGGGPLAVSLGIGGHHNALNALAALAAADALGIPAEQAAEALASFRLPARRFDVVAEARGITVVSDYAHHPTEIAALLVQARQWGPKRLIGVFQPHRYSRTRQFAAAFADVLRELDLVALVPVYSASETFVEGGSIEDLYARIRSRGIESVELFESLDEAWTALRDVLTEGDMLLVIGAGDVEQIAAWAAEALA